MTLKPFHYQINLQPEAGHISLTLPPALEEAETEGVPYTWLEVWQQLKERLRGTERFWQPGAAVWLLAQDHLLDGRHFQMVAEALAEFQLDLQRVCTSRRQTAVAAAAAGYSVDQRTFAASLNQPPQGVTPPLYLQKTLRSGTEVYHPGTVVVFGDVNPGSAVIAGRDILVWGRLRGVAHAGAQGDTQCIIAAVQMEPTQLRIGSLVARPPQSSPADQRPEVAHVTPEGIRLTPGLDFLKNSASLMLKE